MTKNKNKTKPKAVSELRQDIITGDWVIIATGRAKRPEDFTKDKETLVETGECPFCLPGINNQEPDTLIYYRNEDEWSLRVFPNKFPALSRNIKLNHREEGMYFAMDGVGYHEVIVTKDHDKGVPKMLQAEVAEVLDAFKTRYQDLMKRKSVNYVLFIENHGKLSGASLAHPHWQLFAVPVVSPQIRLELEGSRMYKRSNRSCVYCDIIEQELKEKTRLIFENDNFLAITPFASRSPFEVWILPKAHKPYFERITEQEELDAAEILKKVLEQYYWKLQDISYNMYLHTSPCDGKDYSHYHWHIELLPKTSIWAGFELGTGIEISTIEPEKAAQFLKDN